MSLNNLEDVLLERASTLMIQLRGRTVYLGMQREGKKYSHETGR